MSDPLDQSRELEALRAELASSGRVAAVEHAERCEVTIAELRAALVELEAERARWQPVVDIVEGFTLEWAKAAQKDDHLCNLDHKDEMIFGELIEAILHARRQGGEAMKIPHCCPVCFGHGTVSKPPWISGDQPSWTASGTSHWPCRACLGMGIIWSEEK